MNKKIFLTATAILIFLLAGAQLISSSGEVVDLQFIEEIPNFIAGEEIQVKFSFDYPDVSGSYPYQKENSPLVIFVNVSSNNDDYPVWKKDFEISGEMKVDGILYDKIYNFECYENRFELDFPWMIEIKKIPEGVFYCTDENLLAMLLESQNEVTLNVKSNPALFPGNYSFTVGLYYPENISEQANLTIYSPLDGIFNEKRIPFNITAEREVKEIAYIDWTDKRPREKTLCRNCEEYGFERAKTKTFSDGEHLLTIKLIDYDEKEISENISFFIDSKKPSISKTSPLRGFSDGKFYLEFKEDNPEQINLYYGTFEDFRVENLDVANCYYDKRKYSCDTEIDLEDFNGKEISYHFEVIDIAGNSDISRERELNVDTTSPEIIDFSFQRNRKRVEFIFEIEELNFDEITYVDFEDTRPREKTFCTRLKNGICEKKISFSKGEHDLTFYILDEAGNKAEVNDVEFEID